MDIAGLVKGASDGEGLGNKFLQHIREVAVIAEVVRIFEDDKVIHVDGKIDPLKDIEVINLELVLADLQVVAKRMEGNNRDVKRGDKEAILLGGALQKLRTVLEEGKLALSAVLLEAEYEAVKPLQLLTHKSILYILNRKAGGKNLDTIRTTNGYESTNITTPESPPLKGGEEAVDERWERLMEFFKTNNLKWVAVDAGVEEGLKDFVGDEKKEFRQELYGNDGSTSLTTSDGVNDLIRKGYETLDLITYFTTGEDETRAWTIKKGRTAPEAGTAIHGDFKEKFVRAEIIEWNKLLEAGSYSSAREKGWVRTEGKEYVVKDGDVIEFKI